MYFQIFKYFLFQVLFTYFYLIGTCHFLVIYDDLRGINHGTVSKIIKNVKKYFLAFSINHLYFTEKF